MLIYFEKPLNCGISGDQLSSHCPCFFTKTQQGILRVEPHYNRLVAFKAAWTGI